MNYILSKAGGGHGALVVVGGAREGRFIESTAEDIS